MFIDRARVSEARQTLYNAAAAFDACHRVDEAIALRSAAEILGGPSTMRLLRKGCERLWIERHRTGA